MKNLKIKNLILAAALAVGLGVTGIAATAQAAEERVLLEADCGHSEDAQTHIYTVYSYDTQDNNRFTHTKHMMYIYRCDICGSLSEETEDIEEPHELVNRSGNIWECVHCDYWE